MKKGGYRIYFKRDEIENQKQWKYYADAQTIDTDIQSLAIQLLTHNSYHNIYSHIAFEFSFFPSGLIDTKIKI